MQLELSIIEEHQRFIRTPQCDVRLRLVFTIDPKETPLTPRPGIVCARSEGCIICSNVLDELREAGFRIVDVGVLSAAIEVNDIGRAEAPTPTPAGGLPQ